MSGQTKNKSTFDDCKVLKLAEELSEMIYEKSTTLEKTEHFSSGVATKMRNNSDKLVSKIRSGWIKVAKSKKAEDYAQAIERANEIIRLIKISIKIDDVKDIWNKPLELLTDDIVPQLERLHHSVRKKG